VSALSPKRRIACVTVLLGLPVLISALLTSPASAHGSMQSPVSRVYSCYLANPEQPTNPACQAAIAAGGTQAFYDWNGVRLADANGNSRSLIPDGELCSAGNAEFRGLDLARDDWPSTNLPAAGSTYTFQWRATAVHKGTFSLYVTNGTYSPTQPLKWSNLGSTPFLTATDPPEVNGVQSMTGQLPQGLHGRQLIYLILQRSDSPEAFYSCSDVVFP
jgi:chitin-binding protein